MRTVCKCSAFRVPQHHDVFRFWKVYSWRPRYLHVCVRVSARGVIFQRFQVRSSVFVTRIKFKNKQLHRINYSIKVEGHASAITSPSSSSSQNDLLEQDALNNKIPKVPGVAFFPRRRRPANSIIIIARH